MATIPDVMAIIEDLSIEDKKAFVRFIHESHIGIMSLCVMLGKKNPNDMGEVAEMMLPGILTPASWDSYLRAQELKKQRDQIRKTVGEEGVGDGQPE